MANYKLNELQEASSTVHDDLFHLRTSSGLDKKITLPNLRQGIISFEEVGSNTTLTGDDDTVDKVQGIKNSSATSVEVELGAGGDKIILVSGEYAEFIWNGTSWLVNNFSSEFIKSFGVSNDITAGKVGFADGENVSGSPLYATSPSISGLGSIDTSPVGGAVIGMQLTRVSDSIVISSYRDGNGDAAVVAYRSTGSGTLTKGAIYNYRGDGTDMYAKGSCRMRDNVFLVADVTSSLYLGLYLLEVNPSTLTITELDHVNEGTATYLEQVVRVTDTTAILTIRQDDAAMKARLVTISGSTIVSIGSEVVIASGVDPVYSMSTNAGDGRIVCMFIDSNIGGDSAQDDLKAVAVSVSGSTITHGNVVQLESSSGVINRGNPMYIDTDKIAFSYGSKSVDVYNLSGVTLSLVRKNTLSISVGYQYLMGALLTSNKLIVGYRESTSLTRMVVVYVNKTTGATVNSAEYTLTSVNTYGVLSFESATTGVVISAFKNGTDHDIREVIVATDDSNIYGVAKSSAVKGEQVAVQMTGILSGLSGLSAGTNYYWNSSGNIVTTVVSGKRLGKAISDSEIFLNIDGL